VVSSCVPANSGMLSSCIGRNGAFCGLGEGGVGVFVGGGGTRSMSGRDELAKGSSNSEVFPDGC
jgi:hypothetical protein